MPLKHSTETLLIVVLGILFFITGAILDILPSLPEGTVLWGVAWAGSVAYPLLLYPVLKERRADYPFRVLHFVPMGMLLLWLILEIASFYRPEVTFAVLWYTWGWSAGVVTIGFAALIGFSWHVLRQRTLRVAVLTLLFISFVTLGAMGEFVPVRSSVLGVFSEVALLANVLKLSPLVEDEAMNEKNLIASDDYEEEAWRMRLRRMERREDRIIVASSSRSTEPPLVREPQKNVLITRDTPVEYGDKAEPPPNLTSSGMMGGMDILGVMMIAGYCGMVHRRMKRVCSL
ncbi:hypothetical protein HYZ98_03085 [Candidatus Peregrinibacteria bacterium]|nr:hypothetical protein [Candidatus Peregrinibacteria bacterium]